MKMDKITGLTSLRIKLMPTVLSEAQKMDNTFSAILRAHLITELCLDELLKLALPEATKAIASLELSYSKKLEFASKLNLTDGYTLLDGDTLGSLRKLNSMRNDFAHNLKHEISDSELEDLYTGNLKKIRDIYGDDECLQCTGVARYLFCIVGNMLPKYEQTKEENLK